MRILKVRRHTSRPANEGASCTTPVYIAQGSRSLRPKHKVPENTYDQTSYCRPKFIVEGKHLAAALKSMRSQRSKLKVPIRAQGTRERLHQISHCRRCPKAHKIHEAQTQGSRRRLQSSIIKLPLVTSKITQCLHARTKGTHIALCTRAS